MTKEFQNTKRTNLNINLVRVFLILIILVSFNFITSCKKEQVEIPTPIETFNVFPEDMFGIINNRKVYFTSIGQSNDVEIFASSVLDLTGLKDIVVDKDLDVEDVDYNSVVIAFVGCSIKALGESGKTLDSEINRGEEFIAGYNNDDFTLISIHSGGPARRGATSDSIINLMFGQSTFDIFVESGNFDKFLSDSAKAGNVPVYQIPSMVSLDKTIKLLNGVRE